MTIAAARMLSRATAAAALVFLAGCQSLPDDPRPGGAGVCAAPAVLGAATPAGKSGFGCATAVNLQAMLADPGDLERGADLPDASGDAALIAVRRHRLGEAKPLAGVAGSDLAMEGP